LASSLRPVVLGHDYQVRTFWIEACRLFYEQPVVRRVSIEHGQLKAFDDVATAYTSAVLDAHDRPVESDHYQNKFHVDYQREIRGDDLAVPRFIGATRYSLLARVAGASGRVTTPHRMTLITPWRVSQTDPLRELVSAVDGEILLHHLFATGASGEMKKLRDRWRAELGDATDAQMVATLEHLRIWDGKSQADLDEKLDRRLDQARLAPINRGAALHPYEALAIQFMRGTARVRHHEHDSLEALLRREKLWIGEPAARPDGPIQLGIKSFAWFAYDLEDEARVLNLVPLFHGRETLEAVDWDLDMVPRLREFLAANIRSGQVYALQFDAHLTIGFAAGYLLDKADAAIVPIQRTPGAGRMAWPPDGRTDTAQLWDDVSWVNVGEGPETAIAIEVTHATFDDTAIYVKRELPRVGRIGRLTIAGGPSRSSVRDGGHAHALADRAGMLIRDLRPAADRGDPLHMFAAAPAALMFLLGRQSVPWGRLTIYEFDPDGGPGAYQPSFHLPAR
jgi:hypothetical protein